jgi:hypothetical protein
MTLHQMHATLPAFSGAGERRALLAGITFLEVTDSDRLEVATLARWFEEHVVASGCMPRLSVVLEPPAGSVALRPSGAALARANADLPRLVDTARARVVGALRGLVTVPSDDRFLRAAIFLGRVRRHEGRWIARPEPTAPLSGIVLSLFAVPLLSERAFYERELCVCEVCGRVSFDRATSSRGLCHVHAARVSALHAVTQAPASRRRAAG